MPLINDFSEQELIDRCLMNDRSAQKALYEKYKCAMYSIAVRLTGNNDDAADVLQDAFIEIFKNIEKFEGRSTLGAWIKTIVVRKAISKFKDKIKFEPIEQEQLNQTADWQDCFTADYLEKVILELLEGTRAVFTLISIEGFKHKEVAKMLHISEGTSKSQLNYAKTLLKQKLLDFK